MRKSSQDLLDNYQIRKSKTEKIAFIDWLEQQLGNQNYLLKKEHYEKDGVNLIVGDLKKAKIILTAHYDTQAISIFPIFMGFSNWISFFISQLWAMLPIVPLSFFGGTILTSGILTLSFKEIIIGILLISLMLLYCFQITKGIANKHTANDNTSGVATLLAILEDLPENKREEVCFVFFDQEEIGLVGSQNFKKQHESLIKDKPLINFDCVSDGDTLFFVTKKAFRESNYNNQLAESTKKIVDKTEKQYKFGTAFKNIYTSDQIIFKNSVGVAAAKKLPVFGYYLNRIHTRKDTRFDYQNIEHLNQVIQDFILHI
ncbi:M28 family peptidase [Vagococcus carniphilus]|uniref:M28 family peptidase n=1 Tax=Vagococcus carniphilus TaxID=218144 RepID=UPI003BAD53EC